MFETMLNIKFWVVFQMAVDLVMVVMVVYFLRNLRSGSSSSRELNGEAGTRIIQILEPLLRDADATAKSFERQLKEKKRLINHLNESLDSRIISLNILLNRTDAVFTSNFSGSVSTERKHVFDQQEAILDQFNCTDYIIFITIWQNVLAVNFSPKCYFTFILTSQFLNSHTEYLRV